MPKKSNPVEEDRPNSEQELLEDKKESKQDSFLTFAKETVYLILIAAIIAWVIRSFVAQPFVVEQQSMVPTLYPRERVLVSRFTYNFSKISRGDIVTLDAPNGDKVLIKRVIAVEGETVEVRNGSVYINHKLIEEPYLVKIRDFSNYGPMEIPENHVFVMGDNRPNSGDSRYFGPVTDDSIIGKAFLVYWPPWWPYWPVYSKQNHVEIIHNPSYK